MKKHYKTYLVKINGEFIPNYSIAAEILGISKQLLRHYIIASNYNLNETIEGKKVEIREYK